MGQYHEKGINAIGTWKVNKIVGFLKRNVGPGNNEVFSHLYKALVIPSLEYAVPLWSSIYCRTLTPWNESKIGPRNTLSRCHLRKKDWQYLGGLVFSQGGLNYLC